MMPFYQELCSYVDKWLRSRRFKSSLGADLVSLPKPSSLEDEIDPDQYHRLAVAWGLSYASDNIGNIIRPTEIDPVPPPKIIDYTEGYIGKDVM